MTVVKLASRFRGVDPSDLDPFTVAWLPISEIRAVLFQYTSQHDRRLVQEKFEALASVLKAARWTDAHAAAHGIKAAKTMRFRGFEIDAMLFELRNMTVIRPRGSARGQ